MSRTRKNGAKKIVPILLAAGPSRPLPFLKALAEFGAKTALQIAVENCAGYGRPILVLGCHASRIRAAVPASVRVVVNGNWRAGQLSSLLAALRLVPRGASFLVYPVDHPVLTQAVVRKLCRAAVGRSGAQKIIMPKFRGRVGHPVIFAPEFRRELVAARTAREVVHRDLRRVKFVKVNCPGIWLDFDSTASYRRCLREYEKQTG
jgi:CTP:molybdopterin cytidylyltransferase MocA